MGDHPVEFDSKWDEEPYALPFHSSDLGNEALRAFFSFLLEGRPTPTTSTLTGCHCSDSA
ncbi:DUF6928 family protein [Streptomyces sp. QHH-9511]|uniref:DUF6928 family protein n=1 Tax=Streptomyces TaxID=1883 RepID=UPI0019AE5EE6|nr:hypothetical protein GCM10010272_60370 [Streptomyces lateritius]